MVDTISSEERSRLMALVRHHGTGPELALRKALWISGLRYRLKTKIRLPGSPDLVFPGAKVAVFVDGCFWHGCPLHGSIPKSHVEFWSSKIARNKTRDIEVDAKLVLAGWLVIRLWEHQIRDSLTTCVDEVRAALASKRSESLRLHR